MKHTRNCHDQRTMPDAYVRYASSRNYKLTKKRMDALHKRIMAKLGYPNEQF